MAFEFIKEELAEARMFKDPKRINVSSQARLADTLYSHLLGLQVMKYENPAMAKNYSDRANGAAIAAGMTYYVKGQNGTRYTPDQMQASWILSQNMAKSIPEVQLNAIMGQLETSDNQTWIYNLTATLRTCDSNLDGQQFYIDFWRELASSGLLKLK